MVMLNTLAGGRAVSQCRPTGGPLGVQTTFLTVEQVLCGGGGGRGGGGGGVQSGGRVPQTPRIGSCVKCEKEGNGRKQDLSHMNILTLERLQVLPL